jgi:DNA-binding XRE family transcriptional regulator
LHWVGLISIHAGMTPKTTAPARPPVHPLTKLRNNAHLTLEDIAKTCRVSRTTPLRWEAGIVEPRPAQRLAYAKALRISVEKLGAIIYAHRVAP